ncbi:MAG: hypothetical protein IPF71_18540 [Rhodoferax sp.]|nr:hypothetical protein [Rhodoferax sp.]
MSAQAVETVVAQLADAGLNLSLAPAGGLAVAPSSHLTADLRALIRSSKALLIDWGGGGGGGGRGVGGCRRPTMPLATHLIHPSIRRTGKSWRRPTTPTTSTARPASPPGAARATDNAAALAWRCGGRIAIDLNPHY